MKRTLLKPIGKVGRRRNWKLKAYLVVYRAERCCELCGCGNMQLWEHHIIKAGRKDYAWNLLIICALCHDHSRWASGTRLDKLEQLQLAERLNEAARIDPQLNFGGVI